MPSDPGAGGWKRPPVYGAGSNWVKSTLTRKFWLLLKRAN